MRVTLPLSVPTLCDGVVELRAFVEQDAPELAAMWRDPDIRARNRIPRPTDEAAREWVAATAASAANGTAWEWAVVEASSGRLAGRRGLKELDWERQRAEASSWLDPAFRGKRFAARSLRMAATHAFESGILLIHGQCDSDNRASLHSMLAAGMRLEGTFPAHAPSTGGAATEQHVLRMLAQDHANAPALPEHSG